MRAWRFRKHRDRGQGLILLLSGVESIAGFNELSNFEIRDRGLLEAGAKTQGT